MVAGVAETVLRSDDPDLVAALERRQRLGQPIKLLGTHWRVAQIVASGDDGFVRVWLEREDVV